MADMELLNAIGTMLDAKLEILEKRIDEKLEALEQRMDAKLEALEQRMDVKLEALEQRINSKLDVMNRRLGNLETRVEAIENSVALIEVRLKKLEVLTENVVIPRIRDIESCYLSTYERYKKDCERMESAFEDIEILKITVHEHSLRLKLCP